MVRSLMAVLALTIFTGFAAGQQPAQEASRIHVVVDGEHLWGLAGFYYDVFSRWRIITEDETSSAEIVTVVGSVFQVGTTVHLDRKMR
ncbi:MAG TPA: hypothetical protein EYQ64_12035 [Gemmatimonadetes bacterium]|nr:hypothetical protein [Gemmatimonadota bacterium]